MKWSLRESTIALLNHRFEKSLLIVQYQGHLYGTSIPFGLRKGEVDSDEGVAAFAISGSFVLTSERAELRG